MDALEYYQGLGYGKINKLLRDTSFDISQCDSKHIGDDEIKKTCQHIKKIDQNLISKDLSNKFFYRGIPGNLIPSLADSGRPLVNLGYVSSSTNYNTVKESYTNEDKCCIIMFTPDSEIKNYTYNYDNIRPDSKLIEHEVLFQRNTQFIFQGKHDTLPNVYTALLQPYNPVKLTNEIKKRIENMENHRKQQMQAIIDGGSDSDDFFKFRNKKYRKNSRRKKYRKNSCRKKYRKNSRRKKYRKNSRRKKYRKNYYRKK